MDEARLSKLLAERETRYIANRHQPEASFKCQEDLALVARVLKARRQMCIGEEVYRHGEEG